jgi:hypothetical protein
MQIHHPCCPCLGTDEACIVDLATALRQGRPEQAYRQALRLVEPDGVAPLLGEVRILTAAMGSHDRCPPAALSREASRGDEAAAPPQQPLLHTIH